MKVTTMKDNWPNVTYTLFKQTLEKLFQMNNALDKSDVGAINQPSFLAHF